MDLRLLSLLLLLALNSIEAAPPKSPLKITNPSKEKSKLPSKEMTISFSTLRREVSNGYASSEDEMTSPTPKVDNDSLLKKTFKKRQMMDSKFSIPLLSDSELLSEGPETSEASHSQGRQFIEGTWGFASAYGIAQEDEISSKGSDYLAQMAEFERSCDDDYEEMLDFDVGRMNTPERRAVMEKNKKMKDD